ncbi:ABC transporter transmembrane domain-containing protein [Arcanobacterium ihumii]|uniref:ABC transporter transmembrane domain-containing protein n=1 Tax=Arcanobacterium ihumii TaxID=2138162 RepID=UPI000F53AC44|nr:ABC transporter ATP-binding protein [Arcanobacterium ihumii]
MSTFRRTRSPRAERVSRAVNERQFEIGPTPNKWPKLAQFGDFPEIDPDHVLRSIIRGNRIHIGAGILGTFALFLGSALIPWAVGILLDSGLDDGLTSAMIPGALITLGIIVFRAMAAFPDFFNVMLYFRGVIGSSLKQVEKYTGIRAGGRQHFASGEIVSAAEGDSRKIGQFLATFAASISAFTSFGIVVILMIRASAPLGLLVGIGLPVVIIGMSFLITPLQNRLKLQREERSKLTTLGTDAVVGLRVLRGVGGEDEYNLRYREQSTALREAGIRAAFVQSILGALSTAIPAIYTAVVISVGLWMIFEGDLTRGELVSFFGYMAFLGAPVSMATQLFHAVPDARVGAERMGRILKIEALTSDANLVEPATGGIGGSEATSTRLDWTHVSLRDPKSGVKIQPGKFTALVAADPNVTAEIAHVLARVNDDHQVFAEVADTNGETLIDLRSIALGDVRQNVVLSSAIAQLFQGRLRSNLAGQFADVPSPRAIGSQMADTGTGTGVAHRDHEMNARMQPSDAMRSALFVADALDIIDSDDGLDAYVSERGRNLSGGQRQRLALARAVLTDAPILILVEPTSAVDSHTEAHIAERLHAQRLDQTTVVVSASPILLNESDQVVFIDNAGKVVDAGTHAELLLNPLYHAVVHRAAGEEGE